jgi:hypothetical protein
VVSTQVQQGTFFRFFFFFFFFLKARLKLQVRILQYLF